MIWLGIVKLDYVRYHRRYQRAGLRSNGDNREAERQEYTSTRKRLKSAIRKVQEISLGQLCQAVDSDL